MEHCYFDCHASYGPRMGKHPLQRWSLEHLLEDYELAGIAGGLVKHAQSLEYDHMLGNLRLVREIEDFRDRLFPCWTVGPNTSDDFPHPKDLIPLLAEHDVRAVYVAPIEMDLPIDEAVWMPLSEQLSEAGIPVLVAAGSFWEDMDKLTQFLHFFRNCDTLLTDHGWRSWRRIVHIMNRFPRVSIEFSSFQANRAVEYFVERFGAERCFYGSALPAKAPGAARGFLDWTLLDEDDAAKVAGGNLRRLLGGVGPETAPPPGKWSDSITAATRAGESLPCEVWDDHCHVLHDDAVSAGNSLIMHRGDADGMLELIRRIGIDKTAMMSWAGPLSGDPDVGNQIVDGAVTRYPDEVYGLVTIRPELQSEEEIQATIQRYHVEKRWPGLKPFPHGVADYDAPGFDSWFRFADEHRLYMVYDPVSCYGAGTKLIEHLTTHYPNMTLHLDHCGRDWRFAVWAAEMANRFPSVFLQLNYTAVTNGTIEYLVNEAGADRVLFGTDAPMRDPRPQASWLVFTRISEADKRKVFGENFARIVKAAFP